MKQPRFITFISRRNEIDGYLRRAPEAAFVFASYSDLGSDAVRINPDCHREMVDEFANLHAQHPFTGVLNRKEKCVIPAAVLANELGLRPILRDPVLARDKHRMRLALNAGEAFPRSILLSSMSQIDAVQEDMFPCVLKPRFGFNSRSVCLVNHRDELRKVYARQHRRYHRLPKQDGTNSDFVLEELITGTEHTIESLVKDGEVLFHLVSDKDAMTPPYFIEVGDLMPSRLPAAEQDQCKRVVTDAVHSIGVQNGWTHTEIKLHQGRPVVIECAARMGGGYFEQMIEQVYGIDRIRMLIDLYLGRALPRHPEPRCHIAARRVVAQGIEQVLGLENAHSVFDQKDVSLIWPHSFEEIPRFVAGPPYDFNNTLFEFFARGESAAAAVRLANDVCARVRVRGFGVPALLLRVWSCLAS